MEQTIEEMILELEKKLNMISDILSVNNHKLDENLIGEYDLAFKAADECAAIAEKLHEKAKRQ